MHQPFTRWAVLCPVLTAWLCVGGVGCSVKKPIRLVNTQGEVALSDWKVAVKKALPEADLATQQGRNLAVSYSEAAIMARYITVREKLLTGRASTNIAFDVAVLGLTTAVPISNGARGKTILGALATGFKGTDLSIDRNVFNEQSTTTILSAIDTCVLRQQKVIADKASLPADNYSIYNGYSDLTRLYGCTTLAGALQELGENQAIAARQAQERTLIIPISSELKQQLTDIRNAYLASIRTPEKALALQFLAELDVAGFTASSSEDALIGAYRALSNVLGNATASTRFIEAAKRAKLLQ